MIRILRLALLFFLTIAPMWGVDLELSSRIDNLYWLTSRQNTTEGLTFKGADLFYNLQGSVALDLNDSLRFKGGIEIDPVLRWRAYSQIGFALDNLSIRFAPFIGTFNSLQKWFNPGMEALVEYTWPGLVMVRGGFLTTFAPVSKAGEYYLSSQNVSVAALVENGIITMSIEDKAATFRVSEVLTTVDASTKYWLDTEMYLKHFPLHWAILTGYQITSRSYVTTSEVSAALHSAILGARLSWDFGGGTLVYAQGESAFFNAGWGSTILSVPATTGIFQSVFGVKYHW